MKVKLSGHLIEITHSDKILFPKTHITKDELITYYRKIAPTMVPYMAGRPLSLHRFPNGIDQEGFYQKNAGSYFPDWIATQTVKRKTQGSVDYVICNDAATLVYLANQGCITPHLWLSKVPKLRYPDRLIFDLDPSGNDFSTVMLGAKILKKILENHGLVPFVMTTGSRGLHVVVPLKPVATFAKTKAFARSIAQQMADAYPDDFTVQLSKKKRKGRVFIDYLRNASAATGVSPYAVRAIEGAPVATPLRWTELTKSLTPQKYTIKNIFTRLSKHTDPWQHIDTYARILK